MKHRYLFYAIITIAIGIISLGLDDWLDGFPLLTTVLYAMMSIIFLVQFIRMYGHQLPVKDSQSTRQQTSLEALSEQYHLTSREQDVIRLIVQGHQNKEISKALLVTVSTVKKHITNIYQKLGIKSRDELMTLFTKLTDVIK